MISEIMSSYLQESMDDGLMRFPSPIMNYLVTCMTRSTRLEARETDDLKHLEMQTVRREWCSLPKPSRHVPPNDTQTTTFNSRNVIGISPNLRPAPGTFLIDSNHRSTTLSTPPHPLRHQPLSSMCDGNLPEQLFPSFLTDILTPFSP